MKQKQLFDLMETIDESYIESATRRADRVRTLRNSLRIGMSVAACALIVAGIFLTQRFLGPKPVDTPLPQTFETETCVVENGLLMAYTGTDTDVVIPDGVARITAASFHENPSVRKFKTVHLSETVKQIDTDAFSEMTSLEAITVSAANPNYVSSEGILGAKDGTLYFTPAAYFDPEQAFFEIIDAMEQDVERYSNISQISFGIGVLGVEFVTSDPGEEYEMTKCLVTSISAFGYTIDKTNEDLGFPLFAALETRFVQTDEAFIMSYGVFNNGRKWVFTEKGVHVFNDYMASESEEADAWGNKGPCTSVIHFEKREDGKIGYVRRPDKYCEMQSIVAIFVCVSHDEFAREEGYITFDEDGEIVYHPETRYTADEVFDLEKEFEIWLDWLNPYDPDYEIKVNCKTLDDVIEYNRQHYEEAK